MSATDELRRLLDERGVEHDDFHDVTFWNDSDGVSYTAFEIYTRGNKKPSTKRLILRRTVTPEQAVDATLGALVTGDTSDGFHTFNELYHHRAVLFSVIVRDHRELAWKSKAHHDGTMYEGMFIVGIETPKGQATYHYDIDPYWDMFDCKELERAPEWDGHTPDDATGRIATLGRGTCKAVQTGGSSWMCSACGCEWRYRDSDGEPFMDVGGSAETPRFCPACGRKVVLSG